MAKVRKVGRVTFRELTNEEALQKYGSSFVFVGPRPASLEQAAKVAYLTVRTLVVEAGRNPIAAPTTAVPL